MHGQTTITIKFFFFFFFSHYYAVLLIGTNILGEPVVPIFRVNEDVGSRLIGIQFT